MGTEALECEHQDVLLGTRGAGALGTLVGSQADQADEICKLFHRISTCEPFAYPDLTNTPSEAEGKPVIYVPNVR